MAQNVLVRSRSRSGSGTETATHPDVDALTAFISPNEAVTRSDALSLVRVPHQTPTLAATTHSNGPDCEALTLLLDSYATALEREIQRASTNAPAAQTGNRDIESLFDIRVQQEFNVPAGAKAIHDGSTTWMHKVQRFFRKLSKILKTKGHRVLGWIGDVLKKFFSQGDNKGTTLDMKASRTKPCNSRGNTKVPEMATMKEKSRWLPSLPSCPRPSVEIETPSSKYKYALVSNPNSRCLWGGGGRMMKVDTRDGMWKEVSWKGGFKGEGAKGKGSTKEGGKRKRNWKDVLVKMST